MTIRAGNNWQWFLGKIKYVMYCGTCRLLSAERSLPTDQKIHQQCDPKPHVKTHVGCSLCNWDQTIKIEYKRPLPTKCQATFLRILKDIFVVWIRGNTRTEFSLKCFMANSKILLNVFNFNKYLFTHFQKCLCFIILYNLYNYII